MIESINPNNITFEIDSLQKIQNFFINDTKLNASEKSIIKIQNVDFFINKTDEVPIIKISNETTLSSSEKSSIKITFKPNLFEIINRTFSVENQLEKSIKKSIDKTLNSLSTLTPNKAVQFQINNKDDSLNFIALTTGRTTTYSKLKEELFQKVKKLFLKLKLMQYKKLKFVRFPLKHFFLFQAIAKKQMFDDLNKSTTSRRTTTIDPNILPAVIPYWAKFNFNLNKTKENQFLSETLLLNQTTLSPKKTTLNFSTNSSPKKNNFNFSTDFIKHEIKNNILNQTFNETKENEIINRNNQTTYLIVICICIFILLIFLLLICYLLKKRQNNELNPVIVNFQTGRSSSTDSSVQLTLP